MLNITAGITVVVRQTSRRNVNRQAAINFSVNLKNWVFKKFNNFLPKFFVPNFF